MSYLMLAGDFPPQVGGIQSYHSHLAAALTALGREVLVIALSQPGDREYDAGCPYAVTRVPPGGSKLATARAMAAGGLEAAAGLQDPLTGIIATKWSPEAWAALRLSGELRAPWGVFGHDREFILTGLNPLKWLAQRDWLGRADVCFAISHYAAANFRRRGVRPERTRMVGCGVDTQGFRPDPERARQLRDDLGLGDGPVLLTVSRLVRKKGHETVLRALPAVREAAGAVRYVIAGEGPDRARFEAMARELELGNSVVFTGRVPAEDLNAYYTLADVMVMASEDVPGEPLEGFGLAYVEAGCCGTPVIGTWVGGIPDAVDHGVTGLLVPPRDPPTLARAIARLLGDPGLARWMGQQGRERAQASRWELVARRVDAAFNELQR
jgi:phosphatidylinositol alpha-1,6-mannosyltransferase